MKNITKKIISTILIGTLALSLAACGKSKAKDDVSLASIHTAVKDAYGENYIPSMTYETQMIEDLFGIKSDWYSDIVAEGPMMSANVDTFIAVHAKKDNVQDVTDALNKYRESLVNDSMQYPMNVPKVNASKVMQSGNYVFFIMLGAIDDNLDASEDELLKTAEAQNEIAVTAINKALGNS